MQLFKKDFDSIGRDSVPGQAIVYVIGPRNSGKTELIKYLSKSNVNATLDVNIPQQRISNVQFIECPNLEDIHHIDKYLTAAFRVDLTGRKRMFAQILLVIDYNTIDPLNTDAETKFGQQIAHVVQLVNGSGGNSKLAKNFDIGIVVTKRIKLDENSRDKYEIRKAALERIQDLLAKEKAKVTKSNNPIQSPMVSKFKKNCVVLIDNFAKDVPRVLSQVFQIKLAFFDSSTEKNDVKQHVTDRETIIEMLEQMTYDKYLTLNFCYPIPKQSEGLVRLQIQITAEFERVSTSSFIDQLLSPSIRECENIYELRRLIHSLRLKIDRLTEQSFAAFFIQTINTYHAPLLEFFPHIIKDHWNSSLRVYRRNYMKFVRKWENSLELLNLIDNELSQNKYHNLFKRSNFISHVRQMGIRDDTKAFAINVNNFQKFLEYFRNVKVYRNKFDMIEDALFFKQLNRLMQQKLSIPQPISVALGVPENSNVVLLIGPEGAGKTTLVQYLADDNLEVIVNDRGFSFMPSVDPNKSFEVKPHDTKKSVVKINNQYYVDLFQVTDDWEFFRNELDTINRLRSFIDCAKSVKFVFVLSAKRDKFADVLKFLTKFCQNIDVHLGNIEFVGTKATAVVSKKDLLASARLDLGEKVEHILNLIEEQNKEFGIFLEPDTSGPLFENKEFKRQKSLILASLEAVKQPTLKTKEDVIYTASRATRNKQLLQQLTNFLDHHYTAKLDTCEDIFKLNQEMNVVCGAMAAMKQNVYGTSEKHFVEILIRKIFRDTSVDLDQLTAFAESFYQMRAFELEATNTVFNETFSMISSNFHIHLYRALSTYKVQRYRRKYNVANLEKWGVGEKQTTDGILVTKENMFEFFQKLCQLGDFEKFESVVAKHQANSNLLRLLNQILAATVKSTDLENPKPMDNKLEVTGRFVICSQHLVESHLKNVAEVEIFSTDVVFIDAPINFLTSGRKVKIVAPRVEIVTAVEDVLDCFIVCQEFSLSHGHYQPGFVGIFNRGSETTAISDSLKEFHHFDLYEYNHQNIQNNYKTFAVDTEIPILYERKLTDFLDFLERESRAYLLRNFGESPLNPTYLALKLLAHQFLAIEFLSRFVDDRKQMIHWCKQLSAYLFNYGRLYPKIYKFLINVIRKLETRLNSEMLYEPQRLLQDLKAELLAYEENSEILGIIRGAKKDSGYDVELKKLKNSVLASIESVFTQFNDCFNEIEIEIAHHETAGSQLDQETEKFQRRHIVSCILKVIRVPMAVMRLTKTPYPAVIGGLMHVSLPLQDEPVEHLTNGNGLENGHAKDKPEIPEVVKLLNKMPLIDVPDHLQEDIFAIQTEQNLKSWERKVKRVQAKILEWYGNVFDTEAQRQLEKIEQFVEKTNKALKDFESYSEGIEGVEDALKEWLASIDCFTENITNFSMPDLIHQCTTYLKSHKRAKHLIRDITVGLDSQESLLECFDEIKGVVKSLIHIAHATLNCDQHRSTKVELIWSMSKVDDLIKTSDADLNETLLDINIQAKVQSIMELAFYCSEELVFPPAQRYSDLHRTLLARADLLRLNNDQILHNLVAEIGTSVRRYQKADIVVDERPFDPELFVASRQVYPLTFFIWRFEDHKSDFEDLLLGKEVTLEAPCFLQTAIQCMEVNLKFCARDQLNQPDIDQYLLGSKIILEHSGVSQFVVGKSKYVKRGISMEFEVGDDQNYKIATPNVSPYTTWKVTVEWADDSVAGLSEVFDLKLTGVGAFYSPVRRDAKKI